MTLRDEIDRRRTALGLTVYRLAKLSGVTVSNLCAWLNRGKPTVGIGSVEKLRSALELEEAKGMGKPRVIIPQPKGEPRRSGEGAL